MKRPTLPTFWRCAAAAAVILGLGLQPLRWGQQALAQDQTPPPHATSRGENFSAKPPAALFASDCTGAGCHKSPQGLAKRQGFGSLAGFLREHYTNSRESAAALANYLSKIPSGPEPKEARTPRGGKPAAAAPALSGPAGWFEGAGSPGPHEAKPPRQPPAHQNAAGHPAGRASRAAVKPEDDPAAASAAHHPAAEPGESPPKLDESAPKPAESAAKPGSPAKPNPTARAQRGRQPAATAAAPPPPAEAAPAPPPPAPPAPQEYDIFD